jgi:hypothetical protein
LRRAHLRLRQATVFGYARTEPLLDQVNDPPIGDPVLDELDQPFVVDGVERAMTLIPLSTTDLPPFPKR